MSQILLLALLLWPSAHLCLSPMGTGELGLEYRLASGGFGSHQKQLFQSPQKIPNDNEKDDDSTVTLMATNELIPRSSLLMKAGNNSTTTTTFQTNNSPQVGPKTTKSPSTMNQNQQQQQASSADDCPNGLLTFELSTGFIYKPASAETLAMVPSTLQLTDCLQSCLQNSSCLAINFEMGLCVLLSSSAQQNPTSLYSSQFPVFTIYAEKKCLLSSASAAAPSPGDTKNKNFNKRRQCQRAWTFERVAGYEMRTKPRRRLKLANKELCMEACLAASDFECRSANWYRQSGECTLSDQDRHSISQAEASDQRIKIQDLYGPSNLTQHQQQHPTKPAVHRLPAAAQPAAGSPGGVYQNFYTATGGGSLSERSRQPSDLLKANQNKQHKTGRQLFADRHLTTQAATQYNLIGNGSSSNDPNLASSPQPIHSDSLGAHWPENQFVVDDDGDSLPANALVDYLENNCVYEPNKLCEFRKIQNKILKTVDSIYQDINSLEECKQKCLQAPYRCYSFDYGDTSERVCRTSHLDQASLMSVKDPYLEVVGAITYELASCFNVTIQCRAREMVAQVSSSKMFKGKIYVKSRPSSCQNDVRESLHFELAMKYHDDTCDVRSGSNQERGVFSNDIIIQHHDRIVTTQDVGLSVYCQYDLGNRSITNNVDLAIERIEEPIGAESASMESKTPGQSSSLSHRPSNSLTITSLATTVVRSPNVTMRITNMNGQPVSSATVGDRLALLFEIKEKTSPFGIFVREIIALDGKQMLKANSSSSTGDLVESLYQANKANSVVFIDSLGCPTDANIMGPLQKMDPAGQRILAPFDAFKFPSSDMVFFRAVVSSCVSECKPVVCGGPSSSSLSSATTTLTAIDFDLSQQQQTVGTPSEHLVASTRNMQPARSSAQGPISTPINLLVGSTAAMAPTTSTKTTLAPNPESAPSKSPTTPAPTSLAAHRSTGSATDTMTTIAGFGNGADLQDASNFVATNMTNNHQIGKIPPRPSQQQQQNSTEGGRPDFPAAPLDLSLLTSQQKQQLVKLFEQRLIRSPQPQMQQSTLEKNQNNSQRLNEMADLYAGFLTSIMLNSGQHADSNAIGSSGTAAASDLDSDSDSNEPPANEQHKRVAQLISDKSESSKPLEEEKLETFLAYLLARLSKRTNDPAETDAGRLPLADILSVLNPDLKSAASKAVANTTTTQSTSDGSQTSNYNDLGSLVHNHRQQQQQQQPQQHFDRSSSNHVARTDDLSSMGDRDVSLDEISPPLLHNKNNNSNRVLSLPAVGQPVSSSSGDATTNERKRFTSYGRRRRRSIREPTEEEEEEEDNHYVRQFVSQAQDSLYLDPLNGRMLPFRQAIVEMYHTSPTHDNRVKRQASQDEQQPQVEELVVQSITILDRLHFTDDDDDDIAATTKPTAGKKSKSRKQSNLISAQQQNNNKYAATEGETEASDIQTKAKWSALSLIMVCLLFIFAQTFLLLICLLDWSSPSSSRRARVAPPVADDCSTMSSRCASVRSVGFWPEDSARLCAIPPAAVGCRPVSSATEARMIPSSSSYDRLDSYLYHLNNNNNNNITMPFDAGNGRPTHYSTSDKLSSIDMPNHKNTWAQID